MFRVKILLHTCISIPAQLVKVLALSRAYIHTFGDEHTTIPTFGSYFFDVVPQKFWNQMSDIVRLL